jgi:asparagine synthase (glutamine-hydrolysing)
MCGIAGLVRLDGEAAEEEPLRAMGARLAHRGPDGTGLLRSGPVGLAHRRLSIIDLATGDQPMERPDLGRAVVFNGEIYNYLELREELRALGHRFQTSSDTEVLLVGHAAWGEALLPRLRGMFAFALWEAGPQRLLLARDPLGKKPLQFALLPGRLLAFASEAKALFALSEVSRAIEPQAIGAYLELLYVPEQVRLYRQLEKLQPGEWLTLQQGRVARGRFRAAVRAQAAGPEPLPFDEACARVDAAVAEAVRLRLRSDVPVGLFLSGGIDSTLVALHAARASPEPLRTFTVGLRGERDERAFAAQVARRLGTRHTELEIDLDAPALLEEVARHWDEPFGDSSAVPMLAMARETSRSVKVVLSGDGGDEIFGGYGSYLRAVRTPVPPGPPGLRRRLLAGLVGPLRAGARRLPPGLARTAARLAQPLRHRLDAAADGAVADPALRHLLAARVSHLAPPAEALRPLLGGAAVQLGPLVAGLPPGLSPLRAAMQTDRSVYLPGDILKKVDVAAMRFGLEVRSPLLDDQLIALADQLPEEHLVRRLPGPEEAWGKRPLKQLVAAELGEAFALRPKQGFGAPLDRWLLDPRFLALAGDGFASERSPIAPWFVPGAPGRVLRAFRAGKRFLAQEVWNLMVLDAWARAARPT